LEEAVVYLGLDTIKALVLSLQIFSVLEPKDADFFSLDELWLHSWDTGKLASRIAHVENLDPALTDHAFIAGLLHDVGKLVLVTAVHAADALEHELRAGEPGVEISLLDQAYLDGLGLGGRVDFWRTIGAPVLCHPAA